jgi:hypothetical protein
MKKFLLNYKEPVIVACCLLLLIIVNVASGYFLNPTILGFFLTPVFFIVFGLSALIFSGISIFRLFKKKYRKKTGFVNALVCTLFIGMNFSGLFPNASNGVEYRLKKFSKSDFQEIENEVELAYEKFGKNSKFFSRGDKGYNQFLDQLKRAHSIFNISSFPIDVFKREDSVRLEWASGLTGGFEIVIYDGKNLPHWADKSKLVHIYENVAFYYKS